MILIVDGDAAASASLERMLKYNGYQTVTVLGGMEALTLLEMHQPKLIILDLDVDGIGGMTVLKAVRADPKFDQTPVLIYTANFSDGVRRAAEGHGAQGFLVKGTLGWSALLEQIRALHDSVR